MSYTVDIVMSDAPQTYSDALALRDELAEARDARLSSPEGEPFEPPSPPMAELHRHLTARYPCICDDPDGPWSDGPLINNFDQRIATLGLSYSRVEEVLPFLFKTATAQGFWVLDAQDEAVHLPNGRVLRPAAQEGAGGAVRRSWQFWKSS